MGQLSLVLSKVVVPGGCEGVWLVDVDAEAIVQNPFINAYKKPLLKLHYSNTCRLKGSVFTETFLKTKQ